MPRWDGGDAAKRSLPPPFDRNLIGVLRHLNRVTRRGKMRQANDWVTASYLHAGMSLLEKHLGPGNSCQCKPAHDRSSLLSFLSQRAVVTEMASNPEPFSRHGKTGAMRDRWKRHKHYVADLVNFAVWLQLHQSAYHISRAQIITRLTSAPDFARAVREVAYWHTAEAAKLPPVRLIHALIAAGEEDPAITDAIARAYRTYLGMWRRLYKQVITTRRMRLRPGLTIDDLTSALSAATDGITLHATSGPQTNVRDHQHREYLMGQITLAIIYAYLIPEDDAGGQTLDQAVAEKFSKPP
jgi:hypothetical protein